MTKIKKIKKIAIISTHSFGYIDFIVEKLNSNESVDLTYVNIDSIAFSYKNNFERLINLLTKIFFSRNLKEKNRTDYITEVIRNKGAFDQIFIIRPDKLETEALICLRENAIEMSCYLFDGIENYKNQKKTLHFFDSIYSYDRKDVAKYNFIFLTNYIYDVVIENVIPKQLVFNISSFDKRFSFIQKTANYLEARDISFLFMIRKGIESNENKITFIKNYLSIAEVKKYISESKILLDVQRENQQGLSFRIFEALGYNKKIITNNVDIVNYDFYDKNNIWVLSEGNYKIPNSFFETEYIPVAPEILHKYMLDSWLKTIFKVE
ncbi:hypothetical protein [Flavobacterium sp. PL11]|jgi:hypothetical protein|uniref:hypothetical protein n=1 Tax=Flavobacterium sp. PL11 TaxID=3071717 RepID=UPI002E15B424